MIRFTTPDLVAPDGSIIGVIAEGGARLDAPEVARVGPGVAVPEKTDNFILDHALAQSDAVTKAQIVARLVQRRRAGATIILISHDETLLESCADEIWWIRGTQLIARGEAADVLPRYRRHVAEALRAAGENIVAQLVPTMRKGDGRAQLESVEPLGDQGAPATIWRSGEAVSIRVTVRFANAVADPVVGIMIRNRIGLNVYGTNTELEKLRLGPVAAGDRLRISYRFRCDLCPGEYTVTAASHDPDGLWHDWMEDAVAVTVTDVRYTAGVANLKALVESEVLGYGSLNVQADHV
jgi:lipopolysaccharide transport system ATP-binding protein